MCVVGAIAGCVQNNLKFRLSVGGLRPSKEGSVHYFWAYVVSSLWGIVEGRGGCGTRMGVDPFRPLFLLTGTRLIPTIRGPALIYPAAQQRFMG